MSIQDLIKNSTPRDKKPQPKTTPAPTQGVMAAQPSTQQAPQPQKRTTEELFPTYTAVTQQKSPDEQVKALTPFKKFAVGVYQGVEKVKDVTRALPGQAKELGLTKSLTSVGTGVVRATAALPETIQRVGSSIESVAKKVPEAILKKAVSKIAPEYTPLLETAITVKGASDRLQAKNNPAEIVADSIKNIGEKVATGAESYVGFTEEDKLNTFNQLMQSGGQMIPIMIPGLGASAVATRLGATPAMASMFGATLSATLESGMEAQEVYDTVLAEKNDPVKAQNAADGTFFANMALNVVTNKLSGIFDQSPGVLKRQVYTQYLKNPSNVTEGLVAVAKITKSGAQGYIAEGSQEAAQQIISNIATGRPWTSGLPESFALGGLMGGAFGVVGGTLGTYSGSDKIMGTGPGVQVSEETQSVDNSVNNVDNVEGIDIMTGANTEAETEQIIAQLPKEGTVDYNALAEDVAVLLQSETPETVEKALDFGYGLTKDQARQVIASAEAINARLAQEQQIVEERSLAQMDISSRLSQDSLFNKIKELDNAIETNTAKATAEAIAKYFNPKDLSPEERLEISERIANTPVARNIIEEYTGQKIDSAQDVLDFVQTEGDFFREMAKYDIISTIESAAGAGLSFDPDTNEYRRYPSGLPSWIPDEYKQVAFANKVAEYFKKSSLPPARATREQALYDIIKAKIDAQTEYYKEERTFQLRDLKDDIAFNIQSAVAVDSNLITNDEALNAVREYFTAEEVPVVFVEKIKTARGMEAWGSYSNGVIRLANGTSKDTPHHEAVHAFLDLFVAPQKRKMYLDESIKTYRKIHGEIETQKKIAKIQKLYGDTMSLQSATEIFAEEALADGFFEYLQAQKKKQPAPTAISQILQDFYQAVLDFIDTIVNPNSAKKLYRDLVARKRANRKAKDASIRKFIGEYERFYAGQDAPLPLVSTKAFNQDGDTVRYYSAPTRTKKRGDIQLRRVKDDNGAYIDSFVVTSGSDVIGTFEDVKEAERFAEQMRAEKEVPSVQFGGVTSRIENGMYMILDVKGNAQRLVQEEINIAMANDNTLTVVIPKKYLRGVDIDSLGITVAQDDKTVTIQPAVSQNVQMYKEKIEDAYVGVAPSVLPVIGREDILVMKDFINSVEIGEEITKAEFQMAEKIAEALDISMDRGLGKVKQYFVETLQGKRQIPQKARELFSVKEDAVDPLFEEARKYKSADDFIQAKNPIPDGGFVGRKQMEEWGAKTDILRKAFEGKQFYTPEQLKVRIEKLPKEIEYNGEKYIRGSIGQVTDATTGRLKKISLELISPKLGVKDVFLSGDELLEFYNKTQTNKQGGEMFNVKEDGKRGLSPEFQKKWESFLVVNGKLQSFGETKTILNDAKPVEPLTTTRVNKESKLYKRLKESIESLNESPEYQSTTIEDETAKAMMLIEQNLEQAKKMELGQIAKPADIHLMSISKAIISDALEKGDFKTVSAVASRTSIRASEMGSEISMLQKLDHNSTEYWLNRVMQKKKELIEKQYKISFVEKVKSEKQQARKEINKAFKEEITKFENEIDAFFNKITC